MTNILATIFQQRSQIRLIRFDEQILSKDSLPLRQSSRNELLSSLLARCAMSFDAPGSKRIFIMDKRGEGVPIILTESEELSGIRPIYELIDDAELKLTIFAAKRRNNDEATQHSFIHIPSEVII